MVLERGTVNPDKTHTSTFTGDEPFIGFAGHENKYNELTGLGVIAYTCGDPTLRVKMGLGSEDQTQDDNKVAQAAGNGVGWSLGICLPIIFVLAVVTTLLCLKVHKVIWKDPAHNNVDDEFKNASDETKLLDGD